MGFYRADGFRYTDRQSAGARRILLKIEQKEDVG
jgi:hypothetical protein